MNPTDEHLATELRALRPTPSERFAAELDAWAEAGFPAVERGGATAPRRRKPSAADRLSGFLSGLRPRRLAPAIGIAASLMIVVIAVVASQEGEIGDGSAGPEPAVQEQGDDLGRAGQAQVEGAPGGAGGAQPSAGDIAAEPVPSTALPPSPPVPRADDGLKPGEERVQERSASMTLTTEPGEVDDVADGVVEVVERYEGIVVSSNVSTAADKGQASFDLRIPSANLQAALADLSDLADVSARDEGTLDITAPFVTAEERFGDAKAEVDALLEQLAEADSSTEIASIREQLRIARAELAAARAELGALKQRADFSRLSLTVTGNGDSDGWSIGDAADDAVSILESLAGATLITLAVLIPLGAIAFLTGIGLRASRRRRREQVLDRENGPSGG